MKTFALLVLYFFLCSLTVLLLAQQQNNGPSITTEKGELRISSPGNMVFQAGDGGTVEFRSSNGSGLVVGEKGMKGDKGDKGDMGDTGATGPTGPVGSPGRQGPQGAKGDLGTDGIDGQDGSRGPTGTKGEKGQQGVRGVSATDTSLITWNECAWENLNRDIDYGQIAACTLNKARNDTWIRISWIGNMRIAACTTCCMRWYFTINGQECADPGAIDAIIFQAQNLFMLRNTPIIGTCRSTTSIDGERVIGAGPVRVQFHIMECPLFGGRVYNAYTGWNSVSRIMVEEIIPRENSVTQVRVIPPPVDYVYQPNYCQYFFPHLGINQNRNLGVIARVIFNKKYDYTVLRVAWESNIRKRDCTSCCSRWWIAFDGSACSSYEDITTSIFSSEAQDIFGPTTISGFCTASQDLQIGRGPREIKLMVSPCLTSTFTNSGSGFYSTSRMIVEELPLSRDPMVNSNFYHPQWAHCTYDFISNGHINNGSLDASCSFNKTSGTSSVRVTFNGVLRIYNCINCCMRWYVTLNGAECTSPAPIEAIIYTTNATGLSIHRGSTITGLCEGLPEGPVEAVLNLGPCNGFNRTYDAFTGLSSPSSMTVEELPQPEEASSVQGYHPSWIQCTSPEPLNSFINITDLLVTNASNFTYFTPSDVIQSCSYNKKSNETALKISWDGNIAALDCETCCVRWFITIDGRECSAPGPIDAAIVQDLTRTGMFYDLYRPASVVGICSGTLDQGLNQGTRTVELRVGPCMDSRDFVNDEVPDPSNAVTGLNSVSRFLIEEIPMSDQDCKSELGTVGR